MHFLCCVKIPPCVCPPPLLLLLLTATGLRRRWPRSARCHGHQCRVTAIALELRPLTPQGTIATTTTNYILSPTVQLHRRLRRPLHEAGGGLQYGRRTASSFYPGKNLPSLHSTFFFLVLLESSTASTAYGLCRDFQQHTDHSGFQIGR